MTESNSNRPWLPVDADIDEDFDPLAHADITPIPDTPMVVTPRGGAREVGRSCYQLDTKHATYLVDCGLNQGTGEKFLELHGLAPEDIDAVFLTHAHIDHSGGLPVLEARGLLDRPRSEYVAELFGFEPFDYQARVLDAPEGENARQTTCDRHGDKTVAIAFRCFCMLKRKVMSVKRFVCLRTGLIAMSR